MTTSGMNILECPFCSQLYNKWIISSYNTFLATHYSDGYAKGMFIPVFQSVVKCVNQKCGHFFNVGEATKIATFHEHYFEPKQWRKKNVYDLNHYEPGISELKEALENDFCNKPENEKAVRRLLLKKYNDLYRENKKHQLSEAEKAIYVANIDALIKFNENDNSSVTEKIFLAELYREKGDFRSCMDILATICDEKEHEKILKEKIFSQAKIRHDKVFAVHTIAVKKEYQCDNCGHDMILFDLDKISNSPLEFRYFKCNHQKIVFTAPTKQENMEPEVTQPEKSAANFFQRLFKPKQKPKEEPYSESKEEPYEEFIPIPYIECPSCATQDVEEFDPDSQKCVKCETGNYIHVKWFNE